MEEVRIMKKTRDQNWQMSDTYRIGVLLALAGGFLDAYTFLCRGYAFANAQTGNIVLMGIQAARGEWAGVFFYLVPLVAFFAGILVAEMIRKRYKMSQSIHWRQLVVVLEICILAVAAWIPQGNWNMAANAMISFVCALQIESFRKINGNAFVTTLCTSNLRSATELLYQGVQKKDRGLLTRSIQYFGILLCFVMGAVAGGLLSIAFGLPSVLFVCGLLAVAFGLMFVK